MKKPATAAFGRVCGTATIGPRGQLVIPKEARDNLKLKPGERFLVIENTGKIILIPEKIMRTMMSELTKHLR